MNLFFSIFIFLTLYLEVGYSKSAQEIVAYGENLRSLAGSKSKVRLKNSLDSFSYDLKILSTKGRRALVEFVSPPQERGRWMLAIKYRYWAKFRDSKRVISITRKEALGNSAFEFGDMFQIDTKIDYKILDSKVSGDLVRIKMTAMHKEVSYSSIDYYARTNDHYPVKADFFGPSGKKLKTMVILKSKKMAGKMRPYLIRMDDHLMKNKSTLWTTLSFVVKKIKNANQIFSVSYLKSK